MTTYNNSVNAPFPLFSAATTGPTANGVIIGEGTGAVAAVTLAAGQVLVGATASDPVAATITGSGGVTVTSSTGRYRYIWKWRWYNLGSSINRHSNSRCR